MEIRDLFVATVAFGLGGMMLYAAIVDQGWCFQMSIARKIDETMGREQARTFVGSVGTLLMLLGLYLVFAPVLAATMFQSAGTESGSRNQHVGIRNLAEAD